MSCQDQAKSSNNLLEINSNSGYIAVILIPQTDSAILIPSLCLLLEHFTGAPHQFIFHTKAY